MKVWYVNKLLHRIDGPAVIWPDGSEYWFINGVGYSQEEWFKQLTAEQQYNYLWKLDE